LQIFRPCVAGKGLDVVDEGEYQRVISRKLGCECKRIDIGLYRRSRGRGCTEASFSGTSLTVLWWNVSTMTFRQVVGLRVLSSFNGFTKGIEAALTLLFGERKTLDEALLMILILWCLFLGLLSNKSQRKLSGNMKSWGTYLS